MIVINFMGAPGSGKSTGAAYLFAKLKVAGFNVEYVPEVAKDFTYEHNGMALADQSYVFGKQHYRLQRLANQADIVITDSPLALSAYYNKFNGSMPAEEFASLVLKEQEKFNDMMFFVHRVKPYNSSGRNQSETESNTMAQELLDFCHNNNLPVIEITGDITGYDYAYEKFLDFYEKQKIKVERIF